MGVLVADEKTLRMRWVLARVSADLARVEGTVSDENVDGAAGEFCGIVRNAFKHSLGLEEMPTGGEVAALALAHNRFGPEVRLEVQGFAADFSFIENGFKTEFGGSGKQRLGASLEALKSGRTDREALLHAIGRFRGLLPKIFGSR